MSLENSRSFAECLREAQEREMNHVEIDKELIDAETEPPVWVFGVRFCNRKEANAALLHLRQNYKVFRSAYGDPAKLTGMAKI